MKPSDLTILFAEDDPGIQRIYQKQFTKEGYKVVLAEHGARALAELRDQKVDLLVTDLAMPGMDTLEFLSILKKDHSCLPVIVVSGRYLNMEEDFRLKGFKIAAFMNKPVVVSDLREKVEEVLGIKGTPKAGQEKR
jgi:two-component system alkaline phosphatase synthesis response regulator PhoP